MYIGDPSLTTVPETLTEIMHSFHNIVSRKRLTYLEVSYALWKRVLREIHSRWVKTDSCLPRFFFLVL